MTTPLPTDVPVIFNTAIEGFARTYRDRLSPAVRNELAGLGIDLDRIHPAYDLEVFERAMRRAGEALYPELDTTERWRRMGREFARGYAETALGKAVVAAGKVFGVRRTLERIARTFRTGSNYLGVESRVLGPAEVEIRTWMLEPYLPKWSGREMLHLDYRLGILEALMELLGAREPSVRLVDKDLTQQSGRYLIRWAA